MPQPPPPPPKTTVSPKVWALTVVSLIAFPCGAAYWKYGPNFFLPSGSKTLHLSAENWTRDVLPSKTLLFVGGHHRGGTTLLWELLAEHPKVGGFGTPFQTGSDYSEGSFLQDVMPTFGVGSENLYNGQHGREPFGLGSYALAAPEQVHWTEETQAGLVTAAAQRRLLNQWGYFWQGAGAWERPFWLEKTPTNAVASRYLQALVNLGIESEPGTQRDSRARFLFILRHPLANVLAHRPFIPGFRSIADLMQNWLMVAEYIAKDRVRPTPPLSPWLCGLQPLAATWLRRWPGELGSGALTD